MATLGKAWAHGSTSHSARVLRNMLSTVLGQPWGTHSNTASASTRGGSYGVVGDADLLVTSTGGLNWSVAAGRYAAPGTFAAAQGGYAGANDAAATGSVNARHATLTRVDYVCVRVRDTDEDATGAEDDGIHYIAGTAGSGTPSTPSSLGTLDILCEITVPSAAAGTALTFVDKRGRLSAVGAPVVCTSSTLPTAIALRNELEANETDTHARRFWNGSAWVYLYQPAQSFTPVMRGGGVAATVGGGGIAQGAYSIVGGRCHFQIRWIFGSGGGASMPVGVMTFDAPVAFGGSSADYQHVGSGFGIQAGARVDFQVSRDATNNGFQLWGPNQYTSTSPGTVVPLDTWFFSGSYWV